MSRSTPRCRATSAVAPPIPASARRSSARRRSSPPDDHQRQPARFLQDERRPRPRRHHPRAPRPERSSPGGECVRAHRRRQHRHRDREAPGDGPGDVHRASHAGRGGAGRRLGPDARRRRARGREALQQPLLGQGARHRRLELAAELLRAAAQGGCRGALHAGRRGPRALEGAAERDPRDARRGRAKDDWTAKKGRDALTAEWDETGALRLGSAEIMAEYKRLAVTPGTVVHKSGDVDAALKGAAKTVEAAYEFPYLAHASMEPMNCVVALSPDGCEMWNGEQFQTIDQMVVAQQLGLGIEQVKLNQLYAGGSFGRRANPKSDFGLQAAAIRSS